MYDIESVKLAKTAREAVEMRREDPEAIIIAGGSDVLIGIRDGKHAGCRLISIQACDEMRGVSMKEDGTLVIGALTCFTDIARHPLVQQHVPVLGDAVMTVGGPQIRNIGTIGGNTCNGVTSADSAATLMALDAIMEILGPDGVRYLPIGEFYIKAGKVALAGDEILLSVQIPKRSYENCFGHYYKYSMRRAMDIATSTCSANVVLSDDKKTFKRVRIGYGVAGPIPTRVAETEKRAEGMAVTTENIIALANGVTEELHPRDSWRASKALREHMLVEMTIESLHKAVRKAGGSL